MIEEITNRFDWVFRLPMEQQCNVAIGLSLLGAIVTVCVIETCSHRGFRLLAKAIGAASFFALAGFANHATDEWQKLDAELMVRKTQKASEIDASVLVTLVTPKGNRIEIGADHGVRGIDSGVRRCNGSIRRGEGIYADSARQSSAGRMGGTITPLDCNDACSVIAGMLERTGWWNGNDASGSGRFQFSGKVAGESF